MKAVIDIGGTNTRIGLSENSQSFLKIEKFLTPPDFLEAIKKISSILNSQNLSSVVIGVAGTLDRKKGALIKTSHLPDWHNREIAKILSDQLKTPIFLENDAALAGLAEAVLGAGKDFSVVAYLTLGTGIGGALIANGKINHGMQNFEPGHQIIIANGKEWPYCGQKGCLEAYISGTAWPKEKPFTDEYYNYLGQGLANIIALWNPEVVVLGGSLTNDISTDLVKNWLDKNLLILPTPPILRRVLGDEAGLRGGLIHQPR